MTPQHSLRFLALFLAFPTFAAAQSFAPSIVASIKDSPRDGLGDSFNASPFDGLIRQDPFIKDRAVQEFDLTQVAGAFLQRATLSGTIYVNNAFDVGPRNFDFTLY